MTQERTFLAHRDVTDNGTVLQQRLIEHLLATARLAQTVTEPLPLSSTAAVLGLLHDTGKATHSFQIYLCGRHKKHINHSSAGAFYVFSVMHQYRSDPDFKSYSGSQLFTVMQWLSYTISAHHGLYDFLGWQGDDHHLYNKFDARLFWARSDAGKKAYTEEVLPFITEELDPACQATFGKSLSTLLKEAFHELLALQDRLDALAVECTPKEDAAATRDARAFFDACTIRLLLAVLKEADIYDSANCFLAEPQHRFSKEETRQTFENHYQRFQDLYARYTASAEPGSLNEKRTELANLGEEHAHHHKNGIFRFHLPTGAGKTDAGSRYAIANAAAFEKRRVFYITSFLSVLEQSAKSIKEIIGDDAVLEHHSNVVAEKRTAENHQVDDAREDADDYDPRQLLFEDWEWPVILTTMVQFTNVLLKSRASQIRRFAKYIDSTIIIDEVQNIPVEAIYPLNLLQNYLAHIMSVTLVHCSATQPFYDHSALRFRLLYGDDKHDDTDIVPDEAIQSPLFERTNVFFLTENGIDFPLETEDIIGALDDLYDDHTSFLIICNTKRAVRTLWEAISEAYPEDDVFYLTTNLCAAHRLDRIEQIKSLLKENRSDKKLFCVATNLVEAGVDFDFNIVLRSLTGIDSIDQAAGRCNREGNMPDKGSVFIFRYAEDSTKAAALKDIRERANVSAEALQQIPETQRAEPLNMPDLKTFFYKKYFINRSSEMGYPLKNDTSLIKLLGYNEPMRKAWKAYWPSRPFLGHAQSLKSAADAFELIQEYGQAVLVPYKNDDLLKKLIDALETHQYKQARQLLHQLQRYTVNVSIREDISRYTSYHWEDKLFILSPDCYKEDCGIALEEMPCLIS